MGKGSDSDSGGFDLTEFRKLLQLMEKFGVTETQLTKGDESWKVRRGPRQVAVAADPLIAPAVPAVPVAAASATSDVSAATSSGMTIDAPTVGTFYSAANPEDAPFVSVGTKVSADSIVCVIEAMKVFNQIPAEKAGRVMEILVENGDPVEYGQPLFRIEPA